MILKVTTTFISSECFTQNETVVKDLVFVVLDDKTLNHGLT